jgi:outer membrane immunogenic protein
MKKLRLGIIAIGAMIVGPALAADLPLKAAPAPAMAPFSWAGFYIGVNVGYGWGDADTRFDPLPTAAGFIDLGPTIIDARPKGPFAGGQLGYNWQAGTLVWGIETDLQWSDIKGQRSESPIINNVGLPFGAGSSLSTGERLDWFGTTRLRIGFTPASQWLIYATGGVAYGGVKFLANSDFTPVGTQQYPASVNTTKVGWAAGGGVEWAIANNWSAKFEYLAFDLGHETFTANGVPGLPGGTCGGGPTAFCQVRYNWQTFEQVVRVGLNYKL